MSEPSSTHSNRAARERINGGRKMRNPQAAASPMPMLNAMSACQASIHSPGLLLDPISVSVTRSGAPMHHLRLIIGVRGHEGGHQFLQR